MGVMDSARVRQRLVERVEDGATIPQAAAAEGLSARTVQRYAKTDPDFAERLDTARLRRTQVETQVERAPRLPAPVRAAVAGRDREGFIARMWSVLENEDPDSKAWSTAARIIAAWELEAPMVAARRRAEREAEQAEATVDPVVVLEVAEDDQPPIIDAEVIH